MTCEYKSGGQPNPVNTQVLQYIEDLDASQRNVEDVLNILQNLGIIEATDVGYRLADNEDPDIKAQLDAQISDLNEAARLFFGAVGNLVNRRQSSPYTYITVNEGVMSTMEPIPLDQVDYGETTQTKDYTYTEEEQAEMELEAKIDEVFDRKEKKDQVTAKIIVNLQSQIDRLERLNQTKPVTKRLSEIKVLKKKMERIEGLSERLDDYFDFVGYTIALSGRAQNFLDKIEINYALGAEGMTSQERAKILKEISDLKETIDAFYSDEKDKSVTTLLLEKLEALPDSQKKDEIILQLTDAIYAMESVNEKYLEIAIPIHADLLHSFAPIDVNAAIDEKIKAVREGQRLIGLNRSDPEYSAILEDKKLSKEQRRAKLIALNIAQLDKKRISRQSIINELRETHRDSSKFSLYTDPIIYSSDTTIRLFALALKEAELKKNQKTIDFKYKLRDEYRKFRKWKNVGEDNFEKLYEDILEVVTEYRKNENGDYIAVDVLSYVQPIDVTKYYAAFNKFLIEARKKYNYPQNSTYADREEYFKSKEGREYSKAIGDWYAENTEPVEGADEIAREMERGIEYYEAQLARAYREGSQNEIMTLQIELAGLKSEYQKIWRGGKPIGRLTTPKLSKWENPKFKNMPKEAKAYYDILLEAHKEGQKKIGRNAMRKNSWDDFSYAAPTVRRASSEIAIENKKSAKDLLKFDSAKDLLSDNFTVQETDTDFGEFLKANGEKVKSIPRYFTNYVEPSKVSRNITNSMIKFVDMANRYEQKEELLGVVNVMRSAIATRDVQEMSPSGNFIVNKIASRFGYDMPKTKKGKDSRDYQRLEAFIDSYFYGEKEKMAVKRVLGKKISMNKLTSNISTGVAVSTLSFNFLQSGNQLLIDSLMNGQEGIAGQFYSYNDLLWARNKLYGLGGFNTLTGFVDGVAQGFTPKTKLGKMIEMFDAMQNMSGGKGGANSVARKLATTDSLFVLQHLAEYNTTAEKLLALSRTYKGKLKDKDGKVIKNKSGEEADLWDMLIEDKNGKLIVDPRVANFDANKFSMKFSGIVRRTNQLKGDFDQTVMERDHMMKLVMLFRKYFPPAYRKRFGHSDGGIHVDPELGGITEGYYVTFANSLQNALYQMRTGNMKQAAKELYNKDLDKNTKQNLIRFYHEIFTRSLLFVASSLVLGMMDDDDDDSRVMGYIAYQLLRLKTEMGAFSNPYEFARIIENPTAAANLIRNTADLVKATTLLAGYHVGAVDEEDVFYQRRAGRYEKGDAKWVKEFLDVFPVASGIFKSLDPEEALKYYELNN